MSPCNCSSTSCDAAKREGSQLQIVLISVLAWRNSATCNTILEVKNKGGPCRLLIELCALSNFVVVAKP